MFNEEEIKNIKKSREEWGNNAIKNTFERFSERKDKFVPVQEKKLLDSTLLIISKSLTIIEI